MAEKEKKLDVVEDFPQPDAATEKRVQAALHNAIERELKSGDHIAPSIFGDA
jgi:hypothetical protein